MGTNSSKPLPNYEKSTSSRLQRLEIRDEEPEKVTEKSLHIYRKLSFQTPFKAISIAEVATWEHELLQDPKNR